MPDSLAEDRARLRRLQGGLSNGAVSSRPLLRTTDEAGQIPSWPDIPGVRAPLPRVDARRCVWHERAMCSRNNLRRSELVVGPGGVDGHARWDGR